MKNSKETETLKQIPSEKLPCIGCFKNNLFESLQLIQFIFIQTTQNSATYYKEHLQDLVEQYKAISDQENYIKAITENEMNFQQVQLRASYQSNPAQLIDNQNQNLVDNLLADYLEQQQQMIIQQDLQAQRKITEDRKFFRLREEQEAQLLIAMKLEKERKESVHQEELMKQKQLNEERIAQEQIEKKKEQERTMKIKLKQTLPEEPSESSESLIFQFKFPDGTRFFWRILLTHKIQVLFNYIMTMDYYLENYEEFCKDKFDLIQTIPPLSLIDKKQLTIKEAFPSSQQELLYVKLIN